jgi:hypothetical protein
MGIGCPYFFIIFVLLSPMLIIKLHSAKAADELKRNVAIKVSINLFISTLYITLKHKN